MWDAVFSELNPHYTLNVRKCQLLPPFWPFFFLFLIDPQPFWNCNIKPLEYTFNVDSIKFLDFHLASFHILSYRTWGCKIVQCLTKYLLQRTLRLVIKLNFRLQLSSYIYGFWSSLYSPKLSGKHCCRFLKKWQEIWAYRQSERL